MAKKQVEVINGREVYTTKTEMGYPRFYYRHFKSQPTENGVCRGKWYKALMIVESSEDGTLQMVYQALYGEGKIYVRPLDMFLSDVDKKKYPQSDSEYRFTSWNELVVKYGREKVGEMFNDEVMIAY